MTLIDIPCGIIESERNELKRHEANLLRESLPLRMKHIDEMIQFCLDITILYDGELNKPKIKGENK